MIAERGASGRSMAIAAGLKPGTVSAAIRGEIHTTRASTITLLLRAIHQFRPITTMEAARLRDLVGDTNWQRLALQIGLTGPMPSPVGIAAAVPADDLAMMTSELSMRIGRSATRHVLASMLSLVDSLSTPDDRGRLGDAPAQAQPGNDNAARAPGKPGGPGGIRNAVAHERFVTGEDGTVYTIREYHPTSSPPAKPGETAAPTRRKASS